MEEDQDNNSNNNDNNYPTFQKFKLPVEMEALFNFTFQFQGLKETILWIVEHLKEKDTVINNQQTTIDDHKTRIIDLEAQMSDNEELLSWMAKWKANYSEIDLHEIKDGLENAHEKINFNKGEIKQNFDSLNIQNSKIIKNEMNIDEIRKRVDQLENDNLEHNKKIDKNSKEIDDINYTIEMILERLDKVRRTPSNVSTATVKEGLDPSLFVSLE